VDWPTSINITLVLATALFAVVTLALVLAGIFAFINVRRDARAIAEETARETAERITETAANLYLQEHLPEIIAAYADMMSSADAASGAEGDQIAEEESGEI
jgi:hypothetical protein